MGKNRQVRARTHKAMIEWLWAGKYEQVRASTDKYIQVLIGGTLLNTSWWVSGVRGVLGPTSSRCVPILPSCCHLSFTSQSCLVLLSHPGSALASLSNVRCSSFAFASWPCRRIVFIIRQRRCSDCPHHCMPFK